jgi:DNA polymerase-3 subunit epsilon
VLDTLLMARRMHPGQRASLDALCKRYDISNAHREFHGALLDAELLGDVYLAMTTGQTLLSLDAGEAAETGAGRAGAEGACPRPDGQALSVVAADEAESRAHESYLDRLEQTSGGACVWRRDPGTVS